MSLIAEVVNERFLEQEADKYINRRGRKEKRRNKVKAKSHGGMQAFVPPPRIKTIVPKTAAQRKVFEAYDAGKNMILHGVAGSGKTFLSLYLALQSVLSGEAPKPIVIIRSVVPSRDIGFLPGSAKEKAAVYEAPYSSICSELVDRSNPYEWFKTNHYIEFCTTSFLRGITYKDSIIIVDECQNMSDAELNTIMTRVGEGCRIILCGDFNQKDYMREGSGMPNLLKIADHMKSFEIVKFEKGDIVRSGFVKDYIITRINLEERGIIN
jgi:phosphate starvation-inducible protein PhoH